VANEIKKVEEGKELRSIGTGRQFTLNRLPNCQGKETQMSSCAKALRQKRVG
jgi:hypothetical protein